MDGQGFGPSRLDLLRHLLRVLVVEVGSRHTGTLGREPQRIGLADALAGSRDDRDLAVEAAHHPSNCFFMSSSSPRT